MLALTLEDNSLRVIGRLLGTFAVWLGAGLLPFYLVGYASLASRGSTADVLGLNPGISPMVILPGVGLALSLLGLALSHQRGRGVPVACLLALVLNLIVVALCVWPL